MKNRKFFLNLLAFRKADPPEGLRKQGSALLTRGAPSFLKRTLATSLVASMIAGFAPGFAVEAHAATEQTIQGGGIDGETLYTWDRNLTNVVEAPYDEAGLWYKRNNSPTTAIKVTPTKTLTLEGTIASTKYCGGGAKHPLSRMFSYNTNEGLLYREVTASTSASSAKPIATTQSSNFNIPTANAKTVNTYINVPTFRKVTGVATLNSTEYKNIQLQDSSIVSLLGDQKYTSVSTWSGSNYLDNKFAVEEWNSASTASVKLFQESGNTNSVSGSAYCTSSSISFYRGFSSSSYSSPTKCPFCAQEGYSSTFYTHNTANYPAISATYGPKYFWEYTVKPGSGLYWNDDFTKITGQAAVISGNLTSEENKTSLTLSGISADGTATIDTSKSKRITTQATLVIPEDATVVLNNCTINADIVVEPNAVLKLFNCNITSSGNGAGTQYEKQKYPGYNDASKTLAVTNLGGTVLCYSVDIRGPYNQSSFVMAERTEIAVQEENHLQYTSPYTSWSEIINVEGGNSGGNSGGDITIDMGDMSAPMITVERTPSSSATPTDEVSFTVTAVDPQGNDAEKPISIDGGEWQKSPCEFTVNENRTVTVWATDSEGNVREVNVNVSNIDTENPEIISLSANRTTYTSGNVRLTAQASDDQKLADQPYYWSFDPINANGQALTETASASKYFTVTENGEVTLRVKDAMGKFSEEETYTVSIIDHTPPTIAGYTVTPSANANAQDGVLIHVNVEDTADATGDTSGLPTNFVSWDSVWGKEDLRVYENGTYQVKVRDSVGNVSGVMDIPINFIKTEGPYIGSIERDKNASYITSPLKITVNGFDSDGTALEGRAYSWDGGNSWTSLNTKTVTENGEYIVTVRDAAGNTAEESVIVDNIDSFKPTVELRLAREIRTDETTGREKSYWVLKVEAADIGSGINYIEADWDGSTTYDAYKQSDVTAAGVYGVKVYDLAGNSTYEYITITNEMLGISGSESISGGASTPIIIDTGAVGDTGLTAGGLVAEFANPSNVIYGENGVYNKVTKNYSTYDDANYPRAGIALTASITPLDGSYVTGSLELEGVTYDMVFGGWSASETGQWEAELAYGFIPWSAITSDLKNKRMKVQVFEWEDTSKTTLVREGSAVIYVSAQVTDPVIRYTYNKVTGEITIVPTSTVAGIASTKYAVNAGAAQDYTVPFTYIDGSQVKIDVSDNVRQTASITLDSSTLELEGGTGSLPTEGLPSSSSLTSYRFSTRTSESYLINGSSSNTDVVPSSGVFSSILS